MQVSSFVSKEIVLRFEKIVNEFLWGKGKRPKMKISTLYNTKSAGGLKLVVLQAEDKILKIKWIVRGSSAFS